MNTQEVCTKIGSVKQSYSLGGSSKIDTPEELFDKFTQLSVTLPGNAKTWSIQLCSTYFSALSRDLVEHMTSDVSFMIPDLTTITTKASQLEAIRSVSNQATTSFKILWKQK